MPNLKNYIIGFLCSIALTLLAYFPVIKHVHSGHIAFSHHFLVAFVLILATIQLVVQLVFFIHLSTHPKQRLNLILFLPTITIVLVVMLGSLWIMDHLNYNMTPEQMSHEIIHSEAITK